MERYTASCFDTSEERTSLLKRILLYLIQASVDPRIIGITPGLIDRGTSPSRCRKKLIVCLVEAG